MDDVEGLADGEPPAQTPTPPIRILLHDGQGLTGRLHHRWQSSTGAWMYHVSVALWAVTQLGARDVSEPADTEFDAPSSHVRPIDGVSYRGVPLTRHRDAIIRARTGRHLPAPPTLNAADNATLWGVERERYAYDATGPRRTRLHTADCPIHSGPYDLTTAQALQAAAQPGAAVCTLCDAGKTLARLRPGASPGPQDDAQRAGDSRRRSAGGRRA
ncbi:DUF6233 domain-containing protein [Streptomyces sp. NBC_01142]|uniref:DUF6233 domain-containing protein n=1 Tax=Streptomyces sp. NBC_01142 TaxID=2975865 RepID=UPI00225572FE|nr:DUF6233 domain-containing protein [Streptomyces sp. NBC_01142]MCX4826912.1 DUF6233 domain-containing protein [Streptomyces sp. NBC_01142]